MFFKVHFRVISDNASMINNPVTARLITCNTYPPVLLNWNNLPALPMLKKNKAIARTKSSTVKGGAPDPGKKIARYVAKIARKITFKRNSIR